MVRAAANGLPLEIVAGAVDFDDQQVTGRHRRAESRRPREEGRKRMNNNMIGRLPALSAAAALAALGLWATAPAAQAQQVNSGVSIGPSEALSPPNAPPPPPGEHLITQLDPLRQQLSDYGVTLLLDWVSEVLGNPTGGVKQGATYAGQVGFEADIDWNKLAGIQGLTTPHRHRQPRGQQRRPVGGRQPQPDAGDLRRRRRHRRPLSLRLCRGELDARPGGHRGRADAGAE